jgi:hypothetical protein
LVATFQPDRLATTETIVRESFAPLENGSLLDGVRRAQRPEKGEALMFTTRKRPPPFGDGRKETGESAGN